MDGKCLGMTKVIVRPSVRIGAYVNKLENTSPCKWGYEDLEWVFEILKNHVKLMKEKEGKG